jgi:hypothetical protein
MAEPLYTEQSEVTGKWYVVERVFDVDERIAGPFASPEAAENTRRILSALPI